MTLLDRARDIVTAKPTNLGMPVLVAEADLTPTDPPVVRGVAYWHHPRYGLLRERPGLVPETDEFGNLPYVETVDDEGNPALRVFSFVDGSEWQRLSGPSVRPGNRPAPAPEPIEPASAFTGLVAFRPMVGVIVQADPRPVDILSPDAVEHATTHRLDRARLAPSEGRAETIPQMLDRFRRKRIELALAPDGRLVARSPRGRLGDPEREALRRTAPLLKAYIAGTPLRCAWCTDEAVTLLEPESVPSCSRDHGA